MMMEPVSQWMNKINQSVDASDPVWMAWRAMKENDIKTLPVRSHKKIVGIVTAQDIVRTSNHNGGQSMSVREAMSLDPLVVNQETLVVDVVRAMMKKQQQQAIIVNGLMEVMGVFSWSEAFEFFMEQNERPQPLKKGV